MASALYDKLMADMKTAMKAHDMKAVNAIRGVVAKAKDLTVNAGKEMTDDAVLSVVAKGVKQREESIAQFAAAGRADLAEGEKAELEFLRQYLPARTATGSPRGPETGGKRTHNGPHTDMSRATTDAATDWQQTQAQAPFPRTLLRGGR